MGWKRETFDATRPVRARRAFTADGRQLVRGDLFDWRAAGLDGRRVAKLFASGHLGHDVQTEPTVVAFRASPGERVTVEAPRGKKPARTALGR